MPTKPKLEITELDFFRAKNQLKEFLRNDTSGRFQDIDFEGSNMSVLLEVLAYNTYQNNFYTNMAISEMFLDSAQLENSVVSHAKELNYLPRSAKSARAIVQVTINDFSEASSAITIPANTRFTTTQSGERYNFFTEQTYIARQTSPGVFTATSVEIFEGEVIDEAFFVSESKQSIRLLNQNIDVSSIRVFEFFDQALNRVEYTFRKDIFGVNADDAVFYIEPSFDSTYEILFGNDRFGKVPTDNTQVRVFYRITNGAEANGACRFTTSFRTNVNVISVDSASGGAEKETLEDIKFFAPRSIQVQERAVTERDYEILLKQRFNEIKDISVFGGDELDPPRFGKVAISLNLDGGLSETDIQKYNSFLRDKTPVGIQPLFLPPQFMNVTALITVAYSPNQTTKSKDQIEKEIREVIKNYNETFLEKFGSIFEVSRVATLIDDIDPSIKSNNIDVSPYILYSPEIGKADNPNFNFGKPFQSPCRFARESGSQVFNSFVRSSRFVFNGTEAIFEDNGLGKINIVNARDRDRGVFEFIKLNAGTVDYERGIVKLSDFIVDSFAGNGIRVFGNTIEKNVSAPKTKILSLLESDVEIVINEMADSNRPIQERSISTSTPVPFNPLNTIGY